MELKEMIKVMQHFEDGGEIEVKGKKEEDTECGLCDYPLWNWSDYNYRIKEQKQKATIEKWLCRSIEGDFVAIETSNIDKYKLHKKVKLLKAYKMEL